MSDQQQSVWPDGAREAVQAVVFKWVRDQWGDSVDIAGLILATLAPYLQQRTQRMAEALSDINELVPPPPVGVSQSMADRLRLMVAQRDAQRGKSESLVAALRAEVARLRQERDDANALAESRRIAEEGAREMLDHEHAERSQAESLLADADADRHRLRREVARLREDGERIKRCAETIVAVWRELDGQRSSTTCMDRQRFADLARALGQSVSPWTEEEIDAARSARGEGR